MPSRCLLYYITGRTAFPDDEPARRRRLLERIAEAARAGIDYIQLREKDLPIRDLESLAREAVRIIRDTDSNTALLINSRIDVALAVEADGVHLRSDDISPQDVRTIWEKAHAQRSSADPTNTPIIGVSCHTTEEAARAAADHANFAVFAPVFEKRNSDARATGLAQLQEACKINIPVLALGGITLSNAQSCLEAGAAGIAGIRLFQENDVAEIVEKLRA